MRRNDKKRDGNAGKIIIRMIDNRTASDNKLPDDMKTDCGDGSSLLACPETDTNQEHDVLTDDINQQQQALEKAKDDKKRRDKQLQTDKANLQIAKANDRLRALAGIKTE